MEIKKMDIEKKENRGGYRPGAGRKPKHLSDRGIDVSFYLPPDLAAKVREYVAQLRAEAGIIPRPRTGGRIARTPAP
jgi:hypothetical protein